MKDAVMPLHPVDLMTVVVLFLGILRGRKRGLSEELLDTIQWVMIVVLAGLYYSRLSVAFSSGGVVGPAVSNVLAYVMIALGVKFAMMLVKRGIGEKIIGSDVFGGFEYYLGMMAGAVRFGCVYFFLLSLLHAPYYTEEMLATQAKYQEKYYGDIRFPTLGTIQKTFFKESAIGTASERYLAKVLIKPAAAQGADLRNDNSIGRRRERTIDAVLRAK
jgi:uncharacterized membrane protein required for colicin V production